MKYSASMKSLFVFLFISLSSPFALGAVTNKYILPNQAFDLSEPKPEELGEPINLWATNYFIPQYENGTGDIPLRDIEGTELGPKLSLNSWCHSALEGSVRIAFEDGSSKVYNYHANSEEFLVDCSTEIPFDLSKTKFRLSKTSFGEGILNYQLVPFRTIATDPAMIPAGTLIYIPSAKGNQIKIGDSTIIHDGYFFAADRGGAIKDNHIDVFSGINRYVAYFPWVGHNIESTFKAYIVKTPETISLMSKLHKKP
jgi:3D (Asp-Asp-Asp) domain-containing protein